MSSSVFSKPSYSRWWPNHYDGAVLLAVHHPPFTYAPEGGAVKASAHGSSLNMLNDIDKVCASVGIYPHAVISGHVHNYQRFTRRILMANRQIEVPFIICGNGGHVRELRS